MFSKKTTKKHASYPENSAHLLKNPKKNFAFLFFLNFVGNSNPNLLLAQKH